MINAINSAFILFFIIFVEENINLIAVEMELH